MSDWRAARSLLTLRDQVNAAWPGRSKASDGIVGDSRHQAEPTSDHNPALIRGEWIVCAFDVTHDLAHGVDCGRLAAAIVASRDPRIKYLIWNRRILDTRPQFQPWTWQPYTGTSPHTEHLHISVLAAACDDVRPWHIGAEEDELSAADVKAINDNTNSRLGTADRNAKARHAEVIARISAVEASIDADPANPVTQPMLDEAVAKGLKGASITIDTGGTP